MSLSNRSLPKPKNWQDFETATRILFSQILNDPNTQQNGRQGQPQKGVDIYGHRNPTTLVGVQCKQKIDGAVTENELYEEVEKAKQFSPLLSEFILVTTAPRDQKIQTVARKLTEELRISQTPFIVAVWGWEDIEEQASLYTPAWKAFDPSWTPFVEDGFNQVYERIDLLIDKVAPNNEPINDQTSTLEPTKNSQSNIIAQSEDRNTERHGIITALINLVSDNNVTTGLYQLENLREKAWDDSSPSEKYRILVGIASAKAKLDNNVEAANLIFRAVELCPDYRTAKMNLTAAHLLMGEFDIAHELAKKNLKISPENATFAAQLINSRSYLNNCSDPLTDIPSALHKDETVQIACINFYRQKNNPRWLDLAKIGFQKYKGNLQLEILYAEATLEEYITSHQYSFAIAEKDRQLRSSAKALNSYATELISGGGSIPLALAHNSAMALRLTGQDKKAIFILNEGIKTHPNDEDLRLQRAIIDYTRNNLEAALGWLPSTCKMPETQLFKAEVVLANKEPEECLNLLNATDENYLSEKTKTSLIILKVNAYIELGDTDYALKLISNESNKNPVDLFLKTALIHTFIKLNKNDLAEETLEQACELITPESPKNQKLELGHLAYNLGKDNLVMNLLHNSVATNQDSDELRILISSLINSKQWVSAQELFDSIEEEISRLPWFLKAAASLALNSGQANSESRVLNYLKHCPNDVEMQLVRVSIYQREERTKELKQYLNQIDLSALEGLPSLRIKFAAIVYYYCDFHDALKYAYSVLMNNWDDQAAHVSYQGLMFTNHDDKPELLNSENVTLNTVVTLINGDTQTKYRIEDVDNQTFLNEQISSNSELAEKLLGHKVSDEILLNTYPGARPYKIVSVKSCYLDAFHNSLDQFNQRFPNSSEMMKLNLDMSSEESLGDLSEVVKAKAETDHKALSLYTANQLPLSFIASLLGKDNIDSWAGLLLTNTEFLVCQGLHSERQKAINIVVQNNAKGCVVDSITLLLIKRFGIINSIQSALGKISTTKSVLNEFASRKISAEQNISREKGFLSWKNDQLYFEEYTSDQLQSDLKTKEEDLNWLLHNIHIIDSFPKNNLPEEASQMSSLLRDGALDPIIAAEGNDLVLLSEDMGYRNWAESNLGIKSTWLQPVLMQAKHNCQIELDKYHECINSMALNNHTYMALDEKCLFHQLSKDNFIVTEELLKLLEVLGGPKADLSNNSGILASFFDRIWGNCSEHYTGKLMNISYETFTRGRNEELKDLVFIIVRQCSINKRKVVENALNWLIGQYIGTPNFKEVLALKGKL